MSAIPARKPETSSSEAFAMFETFGARLQTSATVLMNSELDLVDSRYWARLATLLSVHVCLTALTDAVGLRFNAWLERGADLVERALRFLLVRDASVATRNASWRFCGKTVMAARNSGFND